ncbi:MAG: response regulator transcription factor [Clostridia bacterium]|jgi:DNA-binding response OmpR family regulator|nr:response regulator transcription factor [Clostridia bacterium]
MNHDMKVMIVDDEEKIVEVIKSYMEKEGYTAVTAYNGKEALEQYKSIRPDLVILDLMLPDVSGEEICRQIRSVGDTPIIMLTAKVEEEYILNGLNMGADDYITKPFSPKQLIARVKAVLRRTQNTAAELKALSYNQGDLIIHIESHSVKKAGLAVSLTPVEFEILLKLAKHPKKVFTREELITFVLGEDYEGYDRTIDTHIKNLRQKIESNSREPQYVLTVYGVGYKFGGE